MPVGPWSPVGPVGPAEPPSTMLDIIPFGPKVIVGFTKGPVGPVHPVYALICVVESVNFNEPYGIYTSVTLEPPSTIWLFWVIFAFDPIAVELLKLLPEQSA